MSAYGTTLAYLYGLQTRGMKFGLRNIRALLRACGSPHTRFPSIHVAGTNGKGSTASFLASIATESGVKTGLYTSPHLVRFTERIRINGTEIPGHRLVAYARQLQPSIEQHQATFFEATTAIAFLYFAEEEVGLAVIETGLGGRLDSTNVLRPLVSVITSIGLDHTEILGSTISSIAKEKGGIIKPHTPVVYGGTKDKALPVLKSIARRKGSKFSLVADRVATSVTRSGVTFSGPGFSLRGVRPGLQGIHQIRNAATALLAWSIAAHRIPRSQRGKVSTGIMKRGLTHVQRNTGLRGRMEKISHGHILLDAAHNPPGIHTLVESLLTGGEEKRTVVFGAMRDKDIPAMLRELAPVVARIVAVAAGNPRSLPVRQLIPLARSLSLNVVAGGSVREGLQRARRFGNRLLVTGSHYVVGEALALLESEAP